jgi:hypothetical protein
MGWNWPLIRKFSFWGAVSLLMACVCIVITLIARLPTKCKPHHDWWQGTVFYEVFPASFKVKYMESYTAVTKLLNSTSQLGRSITESQSWRTVQLTVVLNVNSGIYGC